MIAYNLREDNLNNDPMEYKYGVIISSGVHSGYPVTIVDNHLDVVDNMYTREPVTCLLHLSKDVRQYKSLKLFSDFLYLQFDFKNPPVYRMFDYKFKKLSYSEIVKSLTSVFYDLQPLLQIHSLVGSRSDKLEDDVNYYFGKYVLNDEEEYTILKYKDKYKFYKGVKSFYPDWESEVNDLLYEGNIDFDVYKLAIDKFKLRRDITININKILDDDGNSSILKYKYCERTLKEKIKNSVLIKDSTSTHNIND